MSEDIDRDIKRAFVRRQTQEAMDTAHVHCGCGKLRPTWLMYRCYYCGEFYCEPCAPEHFGKSREEYYKEKEDEESLRHLPST